MWFIFIVAVLCGIILLYLPGALLLRSFRLSLLGSSLFAPPVTVALYGVLAIIYSGMGVRSSWITLFLFPSLIALILMLVSSIISRRAIRSSNSDAVDSGAGLSRINVSSGLQDCRRNWFIMLLYVAVGVAVTGHLFIKCLDGQIRFRSCSTMLGIWASSGNLLIPAITPRWYLGILSQPLAQNSIRWVGIRWSLLLFP